LMRQGNFTEISDKIYDPVTHLPFAGNTIPSGQINPIAQKVANIYPMPNLPGLANNYVENNVLVQKANAGDFRLDYALGDRGSLFGRYSLAKRRYDEPAPGNIFMGANNSDSTNYNEVIGYTRSFGSNRFYEVRAGFNKYNTHQHGEDFGIDENNQLGIPNGNLAGHPETSGFASFRAAGFSNTGSPGFTNSVRIGSTPHLTNNFSWLKQ